MGQTTGLHFWAQGYWVSRVALDEERIANDIRAHKQLQSNQGNLDLGGRVTPQRGFPWGDAHIKGAS